MVDDQLKNIHKALIGFSKRAEKSSQEALVATFVDSEPLFDLLSTPNNQIMYGRRGTGKTHALKFLAENVEDDGDLAIYIDLRSIGSNGSIYSDTSRPLAERAAMLLSDVVLAIHAELEKIAFDKIDKYGDADHITKMVDALKNSVITLKVSGPTVEENKQRILNSREFGATLNAGLKNFSGKLNAKRGNANESERNRSQTGQELLHLDFGSIASSIKALIEQLNLGRLWLLLDEWSEVPFDLQPYLSDLLRRTVITLQNVTIKIGAIEHRSVFSISRPRGEYVGLEVGADIFADLNLDNFLVFDNDQEKATNFFKTLIYRHYASVAGDNTIIKTPDELISTVFTQWPAFEEFVRAVEGVPRDALNLTSSAATKAYGQKISVNHVRSAARDWYQQDKSAITRTTPELSDLLTFIVDEVIGKRRARAFLYPSNSKHELIERLFDSRLLHLLKRNISSHDEPGSRFDVYKIDYGCYVDLINTTKAPQGLFLADDGDFVEVPRDDYRSIRRAILRDVDLEAAFQHHDGSE